MNPLIDNKTDYSHLIDAHLKYLERLCEYSITVEQNSIEQFLDSLLITSELLSEKDFSIRMNSSIEQQKESIRNKVSNPLFLIRSINHANGFISTYGTNYEYISTWFLNNGTYPYIPNRAIIYDNQCSCGLYGNCTTQAYFLTKNSSKVFIEGFRLGCTPSESLHVSTLECLYNETCLDLIQQYTNLTLDRLSIETSRFHRNTTVSKLIDHLFVEQWITTKNYSSYYHQCSPSLCSYTYIQHFNLLYLITFILGLHGGLSIVLDWFSPKIIRIIFKINEKRKQHLTIIESECSTRNISVSANSVTPTPIIHQYILHFSIEYHILIFDF